MHIIIEVLLVSLLVGSASSLSALTGFGTSTISIPILLHFYSLPETIFFVGIIHFVGTIIKMVLYQEGIHMKIIYLFALPSVAASVLGSSLAFTISKAAASRILGFFLIAYVGFIMVHPFYRLKARNHIAITGGATSGFLAGALGLGGAVRAAFLSAFNLPKLTYLFTTNCIAFFTDISRLIAYINLGGSLPQSLIISLFFSTPLALVGSYYARILVRFMSQKHFYLIVITFLGILGLKLVLFPSIGE